jgi:hypothetical protein
MHTLLLRFTKRQNRDAVLVGGGGGIIFCDRTSGACKQRKDIEGWALNREMTRKDHGLRIYYLNQIYVEFVFHRACVYLNKKNKEKKGIDGNV